MTANATARVDSSAAKAQLPTNPITAFTPPFPIKLRGGRAAARTDQNSRNGKSTEILLAQYGREVDVRQMAYVPDRAVD